MTYFGGCRPGELAHSPRWDAVSARLAFFRSSSRSVPGGSAAALERTLLAKALKRSWRDSVCLGRRCLDIARSFPFQGRRERCRAFSSPIHATILAVMAKLCAPPRLNARAKNRGSLGTIARLTWDKNLQMQGCRSAGRQWRAARGPRGAVEAANQGGLYVFLRCSFSTLTQCR